MEDKKEEVGVATSLKRSSFKYIAFLALVVVVIMIVCGLIQISKLNTYAQSMIGRTFYGTCSDSATAYEFTSKNVCICRQYNTDGYAPVLTGEEEMKFSFKGSKNDLTLTIGSDLFDASVDGDNCILDFGDSSTDFCESAGGDIPVLKTDAFVEAYNNCLLGSGKLSDYGVTDDNYIGAAYTLLLEEDVKFPSTAQFESGYVYEEDRYGRAIVYIELSCSNAFGVRQSYERYVFINGYESDGTFSYHKIAYSVENEELLGAYKILNSFGEHPNAKTYGDYTIEENTKPVGLQHVTETLFFNRYSCDTEALDIILYTDSENGNVSAIKITLNAGHYTDIESESQRIIREAILAACNQIMCAARADVLYNGTYNFAENIDTLLASSSLPVTQFVKGGLIVSVDEEYGKTVISVVDGVRYDFTQDYYWTPLMQNVWSASASQGQPSANETPDPDATDSQDVPITTSPPSGGLSFTEALDLSKVWKTEWSEMGYVYSACYAFEENGECYMVIDWNGTEAISGGKGTYAVEGNSATFSLVLDGSSSVVYTYTFDSTNRTFTQASEAGLVSSHKRGDIFTLKEDDFNTVDRIKSLSQTFNGTANPDNADPSDNTSSIGNNNTSNNTGASGNSGTSSNTGLSDNTSSSGSSTIACRHSYADATCTTPKTCTKCGATTGSAAGHTWKYATCTEPATCTTCHETWGNANGHSWREATCSAPKTCQTCKSTEGSALPHNLYYTKCSTCDHTDFSQYTLSSNTFCLDSWFNLGDGSGSHYLEDGEASINIDSNGVCKVTFDKYSYTFTLVQSEVDVHGLHFKCYMNGAQVKNTEITFFFSQNRCDFFNYGDTLGFSQVALNFDM